MCFLEKNILSLDVCGMSLDKVVSFVLRKGVLRFMFIVVSMVVRWVNSFVLVFVRL